MHMCINKLKTYTCRHIWRIYTCNHGNFTVVNFTVTLVAALVSVHRTTKNDNTVLFATSQMSPLSLFYDNLKETVFSPYTMNQHFKIITHNKILHFFNFGKDTQLKSSLCFWFLKHIIQLSIRWVQYFGIAALGNCVNKPESNIHSNVIWKA